MVEEPEGKAASILMEDGAFWEIRPRGRGESRCREPSAVSPATPKGDGPGTSWFLVDADVSGFFSLFTSGDISVAPVFFCMVTSGGDSAAPVFLSFCASVFFSFFAF